MSTVRIVSEPLTDAELFVQMFKELKQVEVVDSSPAEADVVVILLGDTGRSQVDVLPDPPTGAKLVAFSSRHDCGRVRLPGHSEWDEVRPFDFAHLFLEVLAGRERPLAGWPTRPGGLPA